MGEILMGLALMGHSVMGSRELDCKKKLSREKHASWTLMVRFNVSNKLCDYMLKYLEIIYIWIKAAKYVL